VQDHLGSLPQLHQTGAQRELVETHVRAGGVHEPDPVVEPFRILVKHLEDREVDHQSGWNTHLLGRGDRAQAQAVEHDDVGTRGVPGRGEHLGHVPTADLGVVAVPVVLQHVSIRI
jgi:hypothetical protein